MEWHQIGMTSEDAQYLQTRQLSEQQISSIYGVPLFLLNVTEKSTTWGTGLEQISRGFLRFTIAPRLSRHEQTLNRELLLPEEKGRLFFEFDTTQFALGDFKERMDGYAVGVTNGLMSPNEARSLEGMNPREGGDEYWQPLNMAGSENAEATN